MYTDWQLTANLYEYDIDSAEPKPEHKAWLRENATKYRQKRGMSALIFGLASRTGTREHNIKLSKARAKGISDELQRLDWSSMLISTDFFLGEEVGRVLGLKDGIEDGRWRGVFIDLFNPDKVPQYGPARRPRIDIERRVFVSIPIGHKTTDAVPKTPEERRGDAWARFGNDAGQTAGILEPAPSLEKLAWIDDTWDLSEVQVKKRESKTDFVQVDYLDVTYTWASPGGSRKLNNNGKKSTITKEEATNWLNRPVRTFRRSYLIKP
jgi:hypothetical protein